MTCHAGSSQANPFACISGGIATLWGPAHGGANEAVLQMLQKIGNKENIPAALARAKDKREAPIRLELVNASNICQAYMSPAAMQCVNLQYFQSSLFWYTPSSFSGQDTS